MINEQILEAAKEAGAEVLPKSVMYFQNADLERFAAIIERKTIERCAAECNSKLIDQITYAEHAAIKKCAAAIRKLGEQRCTKN